MEPQNTPHQVAVRNDNRLDLSSGRKAILPPINFKPEDELMKDYLPKNLLVTLTQACSKFDDLGPSRNRAAKFARQRVDNVWHHEKSRRKLKHLSEQPPCHCGAGSDISYLLDAKAEKQKLSNIMSQNLESNNDEVTEPMDRNLIPETIIPSEFHVVKHKGAVGLEIYDEMYTTKTDSHEDHLTVFPSMKPSGRQEALQLMQTMNKLLKKAGIPGETEKGKLLEDVTNGSQIENLLKLVKEEQTIYNIIFNEVIRQVSIGCTERGSVLAELRKRYVKLLEGVPKQVKSLHEEVLAQRALDRRLTEELSNFKTSITLLTKELHEIHAHDEEVTKQAIETQAELNEALKESEKNASLLAEYHDLYELQRRRLDYQLSKLIEERDLWAGCAHMLSIKVTKKHNLVTIRRLHLYEKAWYELAHNFAVLLGQEDEKQLQVLAGHIHKWQEIAESFHEKLYNAEKESCKRMKEIESSIGLWAKRFERVVTPDEGSVHPPQTGDIQSLLNDMKSWEAVFNRECERFMGDVLLSCEDDLLQLNKCVDMWIQTAGNVYFNHPTHNGSNHPQQDAMIELNEKVLKLHNDFKLRMSGENGITKVLTRLLHNLDTWINKINSVVHGGETLFDAEWLLLADLFQVQWKESLNNLIRILSSGENEEAEFGYERSEIVDEWLLNKSDVFEVYDSTQKWLCAITSAVENEDSNIVEQVVTTHSNMVRWTITMLIRIAPDMEDRDCPEGLIEEDSSAGLGAAILSESTSELIITRATLLFNWLRSLTDLIVSCLKGIVENIPQNQMEDSPDQEINRNDLIKIENECSGWMDTANLLINEVTGSTIPMKDFLPLVNVGFRTSPYTTFVSNTSDILSDKEGSGVPLNEVKTVNSSVNTIQSKSSGDSHSTCKKGETDAESRRGSDEQINMHVIGHDDNVKKRRMGSVSEDTHPEASSSLSRKDISNLSVEELRTMDLLQEQLMATEIRAQSAEEKAFAAESALKDSEERIRALERTLSKLKEKVVPQSLAPSPQSKTSAISRSSDSPMIITTSPVKSEEANVSSEVRSPSTETPVKPEVADEGSGEPSPSTATPVKPDISVLPSSPTSGDEMTNPIEDVCNSIDSIGEEHRENSSVLCSGPLEGPLKSDEGPPTLSDDSSLNDKHGSVSGSDGD